MKLTDPIIGGGPRVEVDYVAFDSFGVKSMCCRIRTPEATIVVDPGVSAASPSFPLPAEQRTELHQRYTASCRAACGDADAIVISHYHLDHYTPSRDPELYRGRTLFARALDELPPNQAARAERFHRTISGLPSDTVWADGRRFRFGRTEVGFSKPVWHGASDATPGRVIMTWVSRGREKVVVTSDVSGPVDSATADLICAARPGIVVLDGYPTYRLGQFATDLDLVRSIVNLHQILACRSVTRLLVDHHSARDYRYPAYFKLAYDRARTLGKQFGTAAELLGRTSAVSAASFSRASRIRPAATHAAT